MTSCLCRNKSRALVAVLALLLVAPACEKPGPQGRFAPGPLTEKRLRLAVREAGLAVDSMRLDVPEARRPEHPFRAFSPADSLIAPLLERYPLEELVRGAGGDEWLAQLLLKDWVHRAIENGTPGVEAQHALEILRHASQGRKFWCSYFAITYVECALALGWQARKVGLDVLHDSTGMGSRHHGAAEVWSNRFAKWVFIDPQSNLHFEKNGLPLSAREVRSEWLENRGRNVDHVIGVPPDTVHSNPAIVWWEDDLDETSLFFWLYYTDSYATWEQDTPSKFLFPQDSANRGLRWYQNDHQSGSGRPHMGYTKNLFQPVDGFDRAYWTVCVTEPRLVCAEWRTLTLGLDSWCPELECYEAAFGDGPWERIAGPFILRWEIEPGENQLRFRTRNRSGVTGPLASLRLWLD